MAMGSDGSDIEDAELAIEDGDFETAADLLRTAIEDDPGNADAYNYLAFSQRNMGQTDEAMENYARALELSPDHKYTIEYQGELYLQLGNKAGAEANLQRLSELLRFSVSKTAPAWRGNSHHVARFDVSGICVGECLDVTVGSFHLC